MTAVGVWLICIGISDLVAGLSGEPQKGLRTSLAIAVAFVLPIPLNATLDLPLGSTVLMSVIVGATFAGWILLRGDAGEMSERRATVALLYLLLAFVAVAGTASGWTYGGDSLAVDVLAWQPFPHLASVPIDEVVLVCGVVFFLFATSNALVRLVLTAVGTKFSPAEKRLRGGRIIGPMERILIFGLGLAGQPTAAALVISAKGLLRYPELSGMRADPGSSPSARTIDVVTEYLLIGSLTSWVLALFPLVLVPS